jgi:hypothetical protein
LRSSSEYAPSETTTIIGFCRPRSASAAADSARGRSAPVSAGSTSVMTLRSSGLSPPNRDSGVACASTRITIA